MKTKKKSHKKAIIFSILGAVLIIAFALFLNAPKKSTMDSVTAKKGDITTYYSFSGSIETKNRQSTNAEKALQIYKIKVAEGQSVKIGDVLMTTYVGDNIKATIDGEVTKIYVEKDQQLMNGAQLIDVVDYKNLQLTVQVDEYDIKAISINKSATVTINALNKDLTGTVTDISKEGTYQNGVTYFTATISLPIDSSLLVGMSADAKVLNQSVKNVVILPVSTIQFDANNNPYVYMKGDKKPQKIVDVTLGVNDGTNVEVKSGVSSSDTVLVPKAAATATLGMGGQRQSTNGASSTTSTNAAGGSKSK
jgi:multidrug efflux pump subunit AcrA (membrane-fusion protein)